MNLFKPKKNKVIVQVEKSSVCSIYIRNFISNSRLLFYDVCEKSPKGNEKSETLRRATYVPLKYDVTACSQVGNQDINLLHANFSKDLWQNTRAFKVPFTCIEGQDSGNKFTAVINLSFSI